MLVFVDTETTGLTPNKGHLLELALVVTYDDLCEAAVFESLCLPVGKSVDQAVAEDMDDYVRAMHAKNGLIDALRAVEGDERYRRHIVQQRASEFVRLALPMMIETGQCKHCGKRASEHGFVVMSTGQHVSGTCDGLEEGAPASVINVFEPKMISASVETPLAGSTVSFDRAWLREHMPALERLFSYRSVDVSSFTEMAKRWAPEVHAWRLGAGVKKEDMAHRALADVRASIATLRYYRECGFISMGGPHYLTSDQIRERRERVT